MDILNFISWIRGRRQVTSVDPTKTLIPVGLKDGRRDDDYLAGAISVEDLAAQIAPPPTPSVNIYNSNGTLTGNRTLNANNLNLFFNNANIFQSGNGANYNLLLDNNGVLLQSSNQLIVINGNASSIQIGKTSLPQSRYLELNTNVEYFKSVWNNNDIGLKLDFANRTYQLGQITGNNATTLKIDDVAAYPVQVSGTNVAANTAGAASGQFLKIKVNGVDYKIALLNP